MSQLVHQVFVCFVFRGVERRRASWEHRCPQVFLWGHFVEFRSWRENCSLCQPSDLRNTFCTPPDICPLHQSLPPMTQTRLDKYTTDLMQTLHLKTLRHWRKYRKWWEKFSLFYITGFSMAYFHSFEVISIMLIKEGLVPVQSRITN